MTVGAVPTSHLTSTLHAVTPRGCRDLIRTMILGSTSTIGQWFKFDENSATHPILDARCRPASSARMNSDTEPAMYGMDTNPNSHA